MQSVSPIIVLVCWYVPGAIAARAMIRRGHEPLAWIYAAWIGGALCAVAAVAWTWFAPPPPRSVEHSDRPVVPAVDRKAS
jgi:hypothetical protein